MSQLIEQRLRESAHQLHSSLQDMPVDVPAEDELVGGAPTRMDTVRDRRARQSVWLAAAAIALLVAAVGVVIALRNQDTLTAGDSELTPEEIITGFSEAMESTDADAVLNWFNADATVSNSPFELNSRQGPLEPIDGLLADPQERERFSQVLEMEGPQYDPVSCTGSETASTCTYTVRTQQSELTAPDGAWTFVADVVTSEGRISEMDVRAHLDPVELDALDAFFQWSDTAESGLTEDEWADLFENRHDELLAAEQRLRLEYEEFLQQGSEDAAQIATRACTQVADGDDAGTALSGAWALARANSPRIAPRTVARELEIACPGSFEL